jgi:hypothetical protein
MPIDARINMGLRPQTYDAFAAYDTGRAAAQTAQANQMAMQAAQAEAELNRNAMLEAQTLDPNDRAAQQRYALRYGAAATPRLTALSGVDTNFAGRGTERRAEGKFATEQSEAYMEQLPRFAAQFLGVTNIPETAARMRPMVEASGFPTELFDTYVGQLSEMDPAQAQQALQSYLLTTGGGETVVKTRYPNRELATTAAGQEAVNLSSLALDSATGARVPITGPLTVPAEKPIDVVNTDEGMVAIYADGRTELLQRPGGGGGLREAAPPPTPTEQRAAAAAAADEVNVVNRNISNYRTTQNTRQLINDALPLVNYFSAGFLSGTKIVGGTPAANLQSALTSIGANLAFGELARMRAESETGGALGQIVIRELELLESVMDSVSQAQGPPELRAALRNLATKLDTVEREYGRMIGLPPVGAEGEILTDNQTGRSFVSDGTRWVAQ